MTPRPSSSLHALQPLQCHPASPAGLHLDVSVAVSWTAEALQLLYTVTGDTAALHIPLAAVPGPADGLWQHTCLEAFVAAETEQAYHEFNFSPSGQWAAYPFASERVRDTAMPSGSPPDMEWAVTAQALTLRAHLPWAALPRPGRSLCIGLCAVIEEHNGRLSYWALQHPVDRPDFHHPAGRTLRLALPSN